MEKDYAGLVEHMKGLGAVPLVIIYGKEVSDGVQLDYFTTPAFDDADATLKSDIKSTVAKVADNL